jgi:IS4 transposase
MFLDMNSPDSLEPFHLLQRMAPATYLHELSQKYEYGLREGIYSASVVLRMMIWQRLDGNRSTASAVQYLLHSEDAGLRNGCKRWADDHVSPGTGSYCQARRKLPKLMVTEVTQRVITQLRAEMQEGWQGLNRAIFVVDGSTVQLQAAPELVQAYSPGHNQHGKNHWPVMRVVVMHDVYTGLALQPNWGPMYGDAPVSEQALAEAALERLPADAVVLSDANFGIFAFAHAVQQSRRHMVLRLTPARARKLMGSALVKGTDRKVVWRASRWDRTAHPALPEGASLEGRLMVCANPARPDELLYLFTTLDLPVEEILAIYKLRWNIETDLRALKRTVGLHQLSSKSLDMVEKELLVAVAAYNLVRAVMCLAARRGNLTPRELSFSQVQAVVQAALPGLDRAVDEEEYGRKMERMLRYAAMAKLPQRTRARSYPRQVWGRGGRFPTRTEGGNQRG